ncbi:MAG: hypothetical protein NTW07_03140 [candidate division Zixibacteria bacterium]|nr:hypothetical protein [candidate division Zixibacteria bacterium]
MKLGFGIVTRVDHIASVTLHGEPRPTVGLSLDVTVEKENGEIVGSLKQVIMNCFNTRVSKDITDYLKEHFLSLFKVASDFQKSLEGSVPVSFSEPLVIKVGDIEHKLTRAVFSTRSTFTLEVKPVDRYAYKHAGISICKIGGDERTPTISVVQVPRAKDER